MSTKKYDIIIVGAGPGGIFSAYELTKLNSKLKIAIFESGKELTQRKCPIDGEKIKECINCSTCAITHGFGGAGAFSDGKFNITNNFGGTLHEYIGEKQALELMEHVDSINCRFGGEKAKLYSETDKLFKQKCLRNNLHLLDASVRHLGTDINYIVLKNMYKELKNKVDFYFNTHVSSITPDKKQYIVHTDTNEYKCDKCIVSVGRSGSQ